MSLVCWREQPALVHNTPLVLSVLVQSGGGSSRDSCLHSAEEAAAEDRFAYLGPKMPGLPLCCVSIGRRSDSSVHTRVVMCSSLRTKKQGFRIRSYM